MFRLLQELEKEKKEYQSLPFWSWNDELDRNVLVEQIDWMKTKGIGGFFMHARGGLKTSYMSEEWMRCVDTCVVAAKERGMQAWIYDEKGWPSGFAGGKLLTNEENRDTYLTYSIGKYNSEAWLSYSMEGDVLQRITKPIKEECLNLFLNVSQSTVDVLNENVVSQFLTETHEKYLERYGEMFAECFNGVFTDEPQYYCRKTAYTRGLPKVYKEKYKEDLYDSLGLLFVEKEGYRKFRYRYWCTMQELMLKNYAKKIYTWCDEHGIQFTGHYIEEQSLGYQMSCCGGVMPFYEFLHMPGIDWLGRATDNKISLRQVASVAAQLGKKQVISEMYGCCGWDVTPKELKRIGDFQYIGGVNRTCQHLLPYSEHGQRKRDYPSHFSWINPWINPYFKEFNDYFTRLGYILANTKEEVRVAMLHPIRSAYFDYKDDGVQGLESIRELEEAFYEQQEQLSKDQIPFHFLDETLLERHGFVKGNKIGCGGCEYEYLVLPTCYTMGCHTEHLIWEYVKNGGKVFFLDKKPEYREGELYDYSYMESNISYDALKEHLPYRLKEAVYGVHSTLRESEMGPFLFVQNYSDKEQTVCYQLKNGYNSFEKYNLADMTSKVISTDVVLKPDESCILLFSRKTPDTEITKEIIYLPDTGEIIGVTENYLMLDIISYSKDGVCYSEPLPCMGVFQQLLSERYEGPIYMKYTFEVEEKSEHMELITEKCKDFQITVNGHSVVMKDRWERDHQFMKGDILPWVRKGRNEIVSKIPFYQNEDVYSALFGEDDAESLLNCLTYDTEIEPMCLAGDFGVYARQMKQGQKEEILLGQDFYISTRPKRVHNLVKEGFPFFSGSIVLKREIELKQKNVILEFKGRFQGLSVWVNGKKAGNLLFGQQLDISEFARVGVNEIITKLVVSNRNMFGPHHLEGLEEPQTVGPYSWELPNTWKKGRSSQYRESYSFVSIPIN